MTARGLTIAALFAALALGLGACDHLERPLAAGTPCPAAGPAPAPIGCNNLANLRAMASDPADLTRGREMTPGSGARAAGVIEAYEAPPAPRQDSGPNKTAETTQ
jgi:type IV pilus biogenesis protein CpaD/CtpE